MDLFLPCRALELVRRNIILAGILDQQVTILLCKILRKKNKKPACVSGDVKITPYGKRKFTLLN
jgi:hypothetical protein